MDLSFTIFKMMLLITCPIGILLIIYEKRHDTNAEQTFNVFHVPFPSSIEIKKLHMLTANSALTKLSGPFLKESHEASL